MQAGGPTSLFKDFREFMPAVFPRTWPLPSNTVRSRLGLATAVATQVRSTTELSIQERLDGLRVEYHGAVHAVAPLGDRILSADIGDVLGIVSEAQARQAVADAAPRPRPNLHPSARANALRVIYGYDKPQWVGEDAPGRRREHLRVVERVAVCLAAEVWFAPYAHGAWSGIEARPVDLRIDLRSAFHLVWGWVSGQHPALARALVAARTTPQGEILVFAPFARLYARVLELYVDDFDECARLADDLSVLTLTRIESTERGREMDSDLTRPALEYLVGRHRDWLPADPSPEEALVAGAAPIVQEVVRGERAPASAIRLLDDLVGGIRRGAAPASGEELRS